MDWMYGEVGRYKRQMMQWARMNDHFGDMVIDERFFDPEVDGPESIGDAAVALDFGRPPYKDTGAEGAPAGPAEPDRFDSVGQMTNLHTSPLSSAS